MVREPATAVRIPTMSIKNPQRHPSRLRALLGIIWVLAAVAAAVLVLKSQSGELSGIGSVLSHLKEYYLLPSLLLECGSMAAYAQMIRSMLKVGGVDSGFWRMSGIFLASNSITNSIPGGPAFASVYSYRRFRIIGASEGLAGWSIFASNVLAAFSLLLIAGVGLVVSEGNASGVSLVGSILIVTAIVLIALIIVARPIALMSVTVVVLRSLETRLAKSWNLTNKILELREDISKISPSPAMLAKGFLWGLLNWVLDASVLVCAYLATGSPIPFEGLLIAYSAGQLAANFPITPGGLGVVEGSISIALIAFGGNQQDAIAAVLLYRVFSFWMWLLPGFGCYAGFRMADVRHSRVSSESRIAKVGEAD